MQTNIIRSREHILACLSPSPSNPGIIAKASQMAQAFGGKFTALYVRTPSGAKLSKADAERLDANIRMAVELGATVATVAGDNIPLQIAEFARLSDVTKIVIGRSTSRRRLFRDSSVLTEQLTLTAPEIDIYIIPDAAVSKGRHLPSVPGRMLPTFSDWFILIGMLTLATLIGFSFGFLGFTEANIITVYILGAMLSAVFTGGWLCGLVYALGSVLLFNYFFTEPRMTLLAYESGYPFTFGVMLLASVLIGTFARRLREHAGQSALDAYRTKLMFDANRLLQKADTEEQVISVATEQIVRLLSCPVRVYRACDSWEDEGAKLAFSEFRTNSASDHISYGLGVYFPLRVNGEVYAVVALTVKAVPDAFEMGVLTSILGECALALENLHNAAEKEQATLRMHNERVRSNLLRTISHDLRTPLTSISGNASNLLTSEAHLDGATRHRMYRDIYEDSRWLIELVENLLYVTRIEDGQIQLKQSSQLVEELIEEALHHAHVDDRHEIMVHYEQDYLLAYVDANLTVQVIVNLLNNAVKYTPAGCHIILTAGKCAEGVYIRVADDGPGIPDERKSHAFEMFYTGSRLGDGRRSLGLGLGLCRTIAQAHGGSISLTDNSPSGCIFTVTLPSAEAYIHE